MTSLSSLPVQHGPLAIQAGASFRRIGLVNNMARAAMSTTERQFSALLTAASEDAAIDLVQFTVHDEHVHFGTADDPTTPCLPLDMLWDSRVDAIIVTGMEPRASTLEAEPSWTALNRLCDWSEKNAIPAIWSCLAAHAAVLYQDGIHRVRLPRKLSGLFVSERTAVRDRLSADLPMSWQCPHSRLNELPEDELLTAGYRILSRADSIGADVFTRPGCAHALFFQGHPEYRSNTLLREYVRDVRRYLTGEMSCFPDVPTGYFDPESAEEFAAIKSRAGSGADPLLLEEVLAVAKTSKVSGMDQAVAVKLFSNWLNIIPARAGSGPGRDSGAHYV